METLSVWPEADPPTSTRGGSEPRFARHVRVQREAPTVRGSFGRSHRRFSGAPIRVRCEWRVDFPFPSGRGGESAAGETSRRERIAFGRCGPAASGTRTNWSRPVARPSTGIVRAPLRGTAKHDGLGTGHSFEVQRTSTKDFFREVLRLRRDPSGCAFGCGRGTVLRGGTCEPGSDPGEHPQGCDHRAERKRSGLRVASGPDWYATAFGRSAASTALGARQAENLAFHVALGRRDTNRKMDPDREMGMDHFQAPVRRGRRGTCR
jgi:hypothetical protein